jgi:dinuclear metal center YbgI/SA1388 family protein
MQRTAQSRPRVPAASTPTARKSGTAMTGRRVAAETSSASLRRFTVRGLYNAWILVRVAQIAEAVERIAPLALAEEWDNCGLQVGDPRAEANRVLVALTPLPEVFEEAEKKGADFLLFHHPLIFDPLKTIVTSSYPGGLLARAIRNGHAVYAAHTSYDAAPAGVSVALARTLGLGGPLRVLSPRGALRKLVVFVPEENVDAVAKALAEVGAGVIGDYTECTFRTRGTGTFRGGDETNPYLGEKGRLEEVEEVRIETVVPAHTVDLAVEAATAAHPYEEMALDVYPVEGSPEGCGYGRLGTLPEQLTAEELREHVSESLGFPSRLVADSEMRIETVAALGGSGGSFIPEAAASGAHAYVTGDVDYHDALLAESLGLTVIDAGHAATELPSLEPLALRLAELVDVPVEVSQVRR